MFTQGFRPNRKRRGYPKSMFYVDNSLKDGVYTGIHKSSQSVNWNGTIIHILFLK